MIKLDKVSKFYSKDGLINVGLNKISLEFQKGEFVAITGASGSGKSTLSNVISGIDTYEDGELFIDGKPTSHMTIEEMEKYAGNYISFIFQNYNIIENYTVYQNVELALILSGYKRSEVSSRCKELIDKVGLLPFINQKASKLSGGQQQRVVIARALATGSEIIIADEPTGNLDEENSHIIIELLHEISKDKLVLVVSHDYEELQDYVTRKIRLMDGKLVEDTKVREKEIIETKDNKEEKVAITKNEVLKNAWRNIISIPKVTLFKLTLFLFLIIGISVAYGNFLNVNYSGYVNPQEGFEYGDLSPSRLIVSKEDTSTFTENDITKINSMSKVRETLEKSTLLNLSKIVAYPLVDGNPQYYKYREFNVASSAMLDENLIIEGNLPVGEDEVVITKDEAFSSSVKIGDKIRLTEELISYDGKYTNTIEKNVTVVGYVDDLAINDETKRVYVTKEFIESVEGDLNLKFDSLYLKNDLFTSNILNISQSKNIEYSFINDQNDDIDIKISYNLIKEFCETDLNKVEVTVDGNIDVNLCTQKFKSGNSTIIREHAIQRYEFDVNFTVDTSNDNVMVISDIDFNTIFSNNESRNINVITKDYRDSLDVKSNLEKDGYLVVYPFNELDKQEFLQQRNMILGIFIGIAFLLLIVSWIVLTMILKTKEKRFIITRSMGATKKNIRMLSFFELMIVTVFSLIIILIFIIVSKIVNIPFFSNTFQHFGLLEMLLIAVLILINILLINIRIGKMIFSESINMALRKM